MKIVSVRLTEEDLAAIESLVQKGVYISRSEAIRAAVREFLKKERYISTD